MRVKLGEKYVEKCVPFTVTSIDISDNGDVSMLWDDNKGLWITPTQLVNLYQRISPEQGESPATDRQQLKAEIAALANRLQHYATVSGDNEIYVWVNELRQLSAV